MICSAATSVGSWMYMVIFVGVCLDVLFSQYAVTVTVLSDTWDLKGCSENRKTVWKCDSASYKIYLAELRQLAAPGPSLAPHIDASRTSLHQGISSGAEQGLPEGKVMTAKSKQMLTLLYSGSALALKASAQSTRCMNPVARAFGVEDRRW
ncbi:hypothetical protein EV126DRAFT_258740 [Verticillium dahliae]|nr:hypothetical protein EV126DRAFT_258740 [Verticillium dahliae]